MLSGLSAPVGSGAPLPRPPPAAGGACTGNPRASTMILQVLSEVVCWLLNWWLIFQLKWTLWMLKLKALRLRAAHALREYRLSRSVRENVRLVREREAMRQPTTQTARKQPKDPPKVVLHPKKPYVKWKRRRDYKQQEEEDNWYPSTALLDDTIARMGFAEPPPPHNYAWRYQPRGKRARAPGERATPAFEYPESRVLPREFDREAHLRAVQAREEAELEQQREAERRRRERAQKERNDRTNRDNRPEAHLRCGVQPAGWPAEAPDRVDCAKRTTEKERSLHRVREHQRQLEELENLRVAQLAKMDELRRIGREVGGA